MCAKVIAYDFNVVNDEKNENVNNGQKEATLVPM